MIAGEPQPELDSAPPAPGRSRTRRGPKPEEGDGAGAPDPSTPLAPAAQTHSQRRRRSRRLLEDGVIVAVAVVVAIVVRAFVAQAYYIPSGSMEPQLQVNDRVVVSRLAYDLHAPRRGDIVVFKAPPALQAGIRRPGNLLVRWSRDVGVALGLVEDQTVVIKRVIGLPGETVSGRGGHVYVDGDLLYEPYLPPGVATSSFGPVKVPKGDVWVMGDNRGDSEDSRYFGPIPRKTIIGRAIWKVWPPWRASFL